MVLIFGIEVSSFVDVVVVDVVVVVVADVVVVVVDDDDVCMCTYVCVYVCVCILPLTDVVRKSFAFTSIDVCHIVASCSSPPPVVILFIRLSHALCVKNPRLY
jgi:hypothetical protein